MCVLLFIHNLWSSMTTTTYKTGEKTLLEIGKEMGGLTPTMVNKILEHGFEKLKTLLSINEENNNQLKFDFITKKIFEIRKKTATFYIKRLKESDGNAEKFLKKIKQDKLISKSDIKNIRKSEIDGIKILHDYDNKTSEMILMEDIETDENIFKTYQAAVSKNLFLDIKKQ